MMTNPPTTQSETPSGHGMGKAPAQPSTGVEGTTGPYAPVNPGAAQSTTTISDTPPVTTKT